LTDAVDDPGARGPHDDCQSRTHRTARCLNKPHLNTPHLNKNLQNKTRSDPNRKR